MPIPLFLFFQSANTLPSLDIHLIRLLGKLKPIFFSCTFWCPHMRTVAVNLCPHMRTSSYEDSGYRWEFILFLETFTTYSLWMFLGRKSDTNRELGPVLSQISQNCTLLVTKYITNHSNHSGILSKHNFFVIFIYYSPQDRSLSCNYYFLCITFENMLTEVLNYHSYP